VATTWREILRPSWRAGRSRAWDGWQLRLSVGPGQVVSMTLTWDATLFNGTPDQAWDCVFFGTPGSPSGGNDLGQPYDTVEKPATIEPFVTSLTVQAAWAGKDVCDRGRASGNPANGNPDGTDESRSVLLLGHCDRRPRGRALAGSPRPPGTCHRWPGRRAGRCSAQAVPEWVKAGFSPVVMADRMASCYAQVPGERPAPHWPPVLGRIGSARRGPRPG
jgi:hypothetical protein